MLWTADCKMAKFFQKNGNVVEGRQTLDKLTARMQYPSFPPFLLS